MDQTARRRRRNLIQNIAIALLSVSAVLLFAQLQLYNLGTSEDPLYLERLTGEGSPSRLREFPLRYGWSSRTPTAGMAAWASLPTVTAFPPWACGRLWAPSSTLLLLQRMPFGVPSRALPSILIF